MCMVEDDKIRNEVEHQMWVCNEASDEMLHAYVEAYENELAWLLAEQACTEYANTSREEWASVSEGGRRIDGSTLEADNECRRSGAVFPGALSHAGRGAWIVTRSFSGATRARA
jgi:hypothetical protein